MSSYQIDPTVSVVIPTYNRGDAILKTIESALHQDLPSDEVEVIVVDDGSTDDTWQILQHTYGSNQRVRLFSIPNGGVAQARNVGLSEARGEFIAFLDHDDLWLPTKLSLQLRKMRRSPHIGLVYCNWLAIDENGQPMPLSQQITQQRWWRPKSGYAYPWILMPHPLQFLRNPISSMTYPLLRTQQVRDIGGFDPDVVPSDDWDMWIRLAQVTRFAYVPQVLAHYVFHSQQQHRNPVNAYKSWLCIIHKHPVNFLKHPYVWLKGNLFERFCREQLAYHEAKSALVQRDYKLLISLYIRSFFMRPDKAIKKHWIYLILRAYQRNNSPY
jgi:glycosyltransferase involved in cell wall biosynthesis